jgi:hypothetical protein
MEQSIESLDSLEYNTDDTDDSLDLDDVDDVVHDVDDDDLDDVVEDNMIQSIQSIQSTESTESTVESEKGFSKNSIINLARKAGVKCISQCGIEKVRTILDDKLKRMTSQLASFYRSNTGKTITKKMMIEFLESEKIYMTMT